MKKSCDYIHRRHEIKMPGIGHRVIFDEDNRNYNQTKFVKTVWSKNKCCVSTLNRVISSPEI